jgi:tyrosyl-DNA phosphodiesterase 1
MGMHVLAIYADSRNMTNAVYVTNSLPLKSADTPRSEFEIALCDYFAAYSPSRTGQLVSRLRKYDFTSVKARFVASIPGKFEGPSVGKWGLGRLQKLLQEIPTHRNTELFAQVQTTIS